MTITTMAEIFADRDVKLYKHCHIMPGDTTAKERLDAVPAV